MKLKVWSRSLLARPPDPKSAPNFPDLNRPSQHQSCPRSPTGCPVFGGGTASNPGTGCDGLRKAEFYNLDQDLREMFQGGQREMMTELRKHTQSINQVREQVSNIDQRQQDMAELHLDPAERHGSP